MIKIVCVCCRKHMGDIKDKLNAESGEICVSCLKKNYSDAYEHMKEKGLFKPEEIAEAEKD